MAEKAPKPPKGFEHDGEAGFFSVEVLALDDAPGVELTFSADDLIIIPGQAGGGFVTKLLKFATALEAYAKYKPPKVKP